MVDYIYFKTSFHLCKQQLKWFVVSPVFKSSITIANTFPDCLPAERQETGPSNHGLTEAKAALTQVMPDC